MDIICFHGCGQDVKIFRNLLKSLQATLKSHSWVYLRGKYYKKGGGWGWIGDINDRMSDIVELSYKICNPKNTILVGFSEGGEIALELAKYIPDIRGVVSMSPSYTMDISKSIIMCPVVLITSTNDEKYMRRCADKWRKKIIDIIDISHTKGHRVYLPSETRQIIKKKLSIVDI